MTARASFAIPDRDPNRPKVPDVAAAIASYYAKPGNGAGGTCHVVLDDQNLDDSTLRLCLDSAAEQHDEDGAAIMRDMLQMTRSARKRAIRRARGQRHRPRQSRAGKGPWCQPCQTFHAADAETRRAVRCFAADGGETR